MLLSVLLFASISICCVSSCLLNAGVWTLMGQKKLKFSGKLDQIWGKNKQHRSEWRLLGAVFIRIANTCLPLRNQQPDLLLLSEQSSYSRWSKGFGKLFICLKHLPRCIRGKFSLLLWPKEKKKKIRAPHAELALCSHGFAEKTMTDTLLGVAELLFYCEEARGLFYVRYRVLDLLLVASVLPARELCQLGVPKLLDLTTFFISLLWVGKCERCDSHGIRIAFKFNLWNKKEHQGNRKACSQSHHQSMPLSYMSWISLFLGSN